MDPLRCRNRFEREEVNSICGVRTDPFSVLVFSS